MDGKNVFDFVDPEILARLERLEQEEEEYRNKMEFEEQPDDEDDESSDLSEDLLEAHEEVMENKKIIRQKHKMVVGSQLPRKVRDLTATEKFMEKIRTDKQEGLSELKMLSQKKRRETKERLKKSLLNDSMNVSQSEDEEELDEDMMDVEGEIVKKFKKKKLSPEDIEEMKKREKLDKQKQLTVERMKRKIQKGWSRESRVNDADRQIASKMPRHLNSGKRGIGKTDRR
jgi:nucleolar GTP-binding protein